VGSSAYIGVYICGRYISLASNKRLLHRPYIVRLIILSLLFVPSTNPFESELATEFSTASMSLASPFAKREIFSKLDFAYFSINRYNNDKFFR